MKKPELQDFGVASEEYTLYKTGALTKLADERLGRIGCLFSLVAVPVGGTGMWFLTQNGGIAFWVGLSIGLIVWIFSVPIACSVIARFKISRMMKGPFAPRVKEYEEAEAAYRNAQWEAGKERREAERARRQAERAWQAAERVRLRKLSEHWMSLSGIQFERELGTLYRNLGYRVQSTPTSGDQGIDLILRKGGKTTVVQCKSHKQPVGPAVARELYGALVASGANDAILASTGGFTRGVRDFFVRDKLIALILASELTALGETVGDRQPEQLMLDESTHEAPICPVRGCGSQMALRKGQVW